MKITLNLATEPYVDLRSVLLRLRYVMYALVIAAILLVMLLHSERSKAQFATFRVSAMHDQVQSLENRRQSYQSLMRQPKNAAVLNESAYLNSLFRRKSFSWTATMTDLETVLPSGVEVLSIDPRVTKTGAVLIHLRVSGARDRAIALIENLETSRHFAAPRLAAETLAQPATPNGTELPVTESTPVNFDIIADYRPLTLSETKAAPSASRHDAASSARPAKSRHQQLSKPSAAVVQTAAAGGVR